MAADGAVVQIPFGAPARLWQYTPPDQAVPVAANDPAATARCEELRRQAAALLQSATLLFERGSYRVAAEN
jgi:hypothetical protein